MNNIYFIVKCVCGRAHSEIKILVGREKVNWTRACMHTSIYHAYNITHYVAIVICVYSHLDPGYVNTKPTIIYIILYICVRRVQYIRCGYTIIYWVSTSCSLPNFAFDGEFINIMFVFFFFIWNLKCQTTITIFLNSWNNISIVFK